MTQQNPPARLRRLTSFAGFALITGCSAGWPDRITDQPQPAGQPTDDAVAQPVAGGHTLTLRARTAEARSAGIASETPAPEGCLDDSNGGVSGSSTPEAVEVVFRRITLLGAEGTDDADLLRADALTEAAALEVTGDGAELALSIPPAGTYVGMEVELWSVALPLPVALDELPEGEDVTLRGWLTTSGHIAQRDVTASVAGVDGMADGEYWIDMDAGALVSTIEEAADLGDTGAIEPDSGWTEGDTGLGAPGPGDNWPPSDVLRLQDDPTLFATDPAVLTSSAGTSIIWDTGDEDLVIESDEDTALTLIFDLNDRFRWWEALEGDDPSTADGVYTLGEDCGFHLTMPTLHVGMPEE